MSKAAAAGAVAVTGKAGISRGQSVLFTNDPKILQVHRETVSNLMKSAISHCHAHGKFCQPTTHMFTSVAHSYSLQVSYCGAGEQDLLCINERQVMVRSKNMYDQEPPNTSLEGVRSDLEKRYGMVCI